VDSTDLAALRALAAEGIPERTHVSHGGTLPDGGSEGKEVMLARIMVEEHTIRLDRARNS